jgi:hypothetical protein
LTIGLTGIDCADYGTAEQTVVNRALSQAISGVSPGSFSEHVCTNARRRGRRALQATSVAIATTVSVDEAQVRVFCCCIPRPPPQICHYKYSDYGIVRDSENRVPLATLL